ncbi:hypothetical protein Tco_0186622, partial [Tanacetum coccineum]
MIEDTQKSLSPSATLPLNPIVTNIPGHRGNKGKEVKGWTLIFKKEKGINCATMAGESERDVKMATQLADAMDVGNGGVDQGINEGWQEVKRKHRGSKHESSHQSSAH